MNFQSSRIKGHVSLLSLGKVNFFGSLSFVGPIEPLQYPFYMLIDKSGYKYTVDAPSPLTNRLVKYSSHQNKLNIDISLVHKRSNILDQTRVVIIEDTIVIIWSTKYWILFFFRLIRFIDHSIDQIIWGHKSWKEGGESVWWFRTGWCKIFWP